MLAASIAKASFAASDKEPAGSRCIFEVQSLHLSSNDLPPCQLYLNISAYEVAPVVLLNLSRSRTQASTPLRFDVVSLTICRARPCVFNAKIVYNKSLAAFSCFCSSSVPVKTKFFDSSKVILPPLSKMVIIT